MQQIIFSTAVGALLRFAHGLTSPPVSAPSPADTFVIPLRREVHPVHYKGKLVSFKTSYSGIIHVGSPKPQEFRAVFDTGSGHIIIPSAGCRSEACAKKSRYNATLSDTARLLHADGSRALLNGDEVTIGFGKGQVDGDLGEDQVCLGMGARERCLQSGLVLATDMSSDPFQQFDFDAVFGLGLRGLTLSPSFSFLDNAARQSASPLWLFGVFLAEGDDVEESEITFGGHNPDRLLEPLTWVPLARPELGYWQVAVVGIYVNDVKLDLCADGNCTGILDTGTSHLGIPPEYVEDLHQMLVKPAGGARDCRLIQAPTVKIELRGLNLTMNAENYMRRLPLDRDVSGVNCTNATTAGIGPTNATEGKDAAKDCTPKLMSIALPGMGTNMLLLGEPALHRYYTAYDSIGLRAGFGLAKRHKRPPVLPTEEHSEEHLLMRMRGLRGSAL